MILYCDTSALVKKYAHEKESDDFLKLFMDSEDHAISVVGYAETIAAFHKKAREKSISNTILNQMISRFKNDWITFITINIIESINDEIEKLLTKYSLRGFDAIHVASAIVLKKSINENITFACYDERLLFAAKKEHLLIYPEI